jgi:hypothetical protein
MKRKLLLAFILLLIPAISLAGYSAYKQTYKHKEKTTVVQTENQQKKIAENKPAENTQPVQEIQPVEQPKTQTNSQPATQAKPVQQTQQTAQPVQVAQPVQSVQATQSDTQKTYINTDGITVESPNDDPTNATAQCVDGLYSHSLNYQGMCSGHGGVRPVCTKSLDIERIELKYNRDVEQENTRYKNELGYFQEDMNNRGLIQSGGYIAGVEEIERKHTSNLSYLLSLKNIDINIVNSKVCWEK